MSSDDQPQQQQQQGPATKPKKTPVCSYCEKGHAPSKCPLLVPIKRFWTKTVPAVLGMSPLRDTAVKAAHCSLCNSVQHNATKCPATDFTRANMKDLVLLEEGKAKTFIEEAKAVRATLQNLYAELSDGNLRKVRELNKNADEEEEEEADDGRTDADAPAKKKKKSKKNKRRDHAEDNDDDEAPERPSKKKSPAKQVPERQPQPEQQGAADDDDATVYAPLAGPKSAPSLSEFPCMVAPMRDPQNRTVGVQTHVELRGLVELDDLANTCDVPPGTAASWLTSTMRRDGASGVTMRLNLARGTVSLQRPGKPAERFRLMLKRTTSDK